MGTNYYLTEKCNACGHEKRLHIGKSSMGWVFALHIYPTEDPFDVARPQTMDDWIRLITRRDRIIRDEYGRLVGADEMLISIMCRPAMSRTRDEVMGDGSWYDEHLGLWRTKADEPHLHCNGAGTWDEMVGTEDSW